MTQEPKQSAPSEPEMFTKQPITIEALRLDDGTTPSFAANWCGGRACGVGDINAKQWIEIDTLEGVMRADYGDWIIKGVKGEFYPCKPDVFEMTYKPTPHPVSAAQDSVLPDLDVTDADRVAAIDLEDLEPNVRYRTPSPFEKLACRERQLLAALSELSSLRSKIGEDAIHIAYLGGKWDEEAGRRLSAETERDQLREIIQQRTASPEASPVLARKEGKA